MCNIFDIPTSGHAFKADRVSRIGDHPVFIPKTISTQYGPRYISASSPTTIPRDPVDAMALASRVDREADHHLAEGRIGLAERLSHLALECRARATGGRA